MMRANARSVTWTLAILALTASRISAETSLVAAQIRSVDPVGRGLTIEIGDELFGRDMKLVDGASITINGKPAELADLQPGMKATMSVDVKASLVIRISAKGDSKSKPSKPAKTTESSDRSEEGTNTPSDGSEEKGKNPTGEKRSKKDEDAAAAAIEANGDCPKELEKVDDLVRRYMVSKKIRGGVVAVVKGGKCVLARGYGHADEGKTAAADVTTLFPVVGVSRVFTGVAVLKLAEEGKMKLDEKFVDAAQLPIHQLDDPKIKANSKFFQLTTNHMLKDSMGIEQDPFFASLFKNEQLRMASTMVINGMPDREGFHFDIDAPPGGLDLQYMLLGRLIAKAAGGRYEPFVKRTILDVLGTSNAKVAIIGVEDKDEREKTKRRKRSGKGQAEQESYDGVADVVSESRKPYEDPSMQIDSSGGWLCSAMDLARFAMAFDDPAQSKLLKADSIEIMLSKSDGGGKKGEKADGGGIGVADRVFAQKKKESDVGAKRKLGSSYFTCGWNVYSTKTKGESSVTSRRRYVYSGPAAITSEGDTHVVLLFTLGMSPKAGEHPLMKDIYAALDRVTTWPDVDYFKSPPSTQPKPGGGDLAGQSPMPSADPGNPTPMPGSPMPPASGLPKAAAPVTTKGRLMALLSEALAINMEFSATAGQALIAELRTNGNNYLAASAKVPQAKAAAEKVLNRMSELVTTALQISANVGPSDEAPARELGNYLNLSYRATKGLLDLLTLTDANAQRVASEKQIEKEQAAIRGLNTFLTTALKAYPPEIKGASSDAEFLDSANTVGLFLIAAQGERTIAVNARRGAIIAIQAKGAGAAINEQLQLDGLYGEIREVGKRLAEGLQPIGEIAKKFVDAESKAAGSKYVEAWKAMSAYVDAEIEMCVFLSKYGSAEAKPDDEQTINANLQAAQQKAQAALQQIQSGKEVAAQPPAAEK